MATKQRQPSREEQLRIQIAYIYQDYVATERLHLAALARQDVALTNAENLFKQELDFQAMLVRDAYHALQIKRSERERQFQESVTRYQGFWVKIKLFFQFYFGGNMIMAQAVTEVREIKARRTQADEEERNLLSRWLYESRRLDLLQFSQNIPETPQLKAARAEVRLLHNELILLNRKLQSKEQELNSLLGIHP